MTLTSCCIRSSCPPRRTGSSSSTSESLWTLRPFGAEDRRGAWCIGPAMGAIEIYAKCFTVEEEFRLEIVILELFLNA